MNDAQTLDYVKATAALMRLPLDAAQAARVAVHLQRTAAMAGLLESAALVPHDELAQIYCPAPFPKSDPAPSKGRR
jgi:hypothetical protein